MLIKKSFLYIKIDNYSEGYLYVRAIATDEAGNVSDSSESAYYVQHIIDKLLLKLKSVNAVGNNGYIEISWIQGIIDLAKYSCKAKSENGAYIT